MAQQLAELDDDAMYNFSSRINQQKYQAQVEMDLEMERKACANVDCEDDVEPTFEPCNTPRVDIDEQRIFQDSFVQAINEKDVSSLP